MFGKAPTPAAPTPPPPPANPPMFGAQAAKKKGGGMTPAIFDASAAGTVPSGTGTAQKSLLG